MGLSEAQLWLGAFAFAAVQGVGDRLFGGQGRALGPRGVSLAPDRFLQRRDRGFLSSVPDLSGPHPCVAGWPERPAPTTDADPPGPIRARRSVSRLGRTLFGSARHLRKPFDPLLATLDLRRRRSADSCHAESYRARTRQFSRCQGQIDALTHIGTPVPQGIWGDVVGHEVSVQAVRSLLPCRVFTLASGAKRLAEEAWVPAI